MSKPLNYQDMILRLVDYWKEQGCVVWNPYNIQVGAGTMNPATALRVLGPEPWNVVYVEPSIRPDDGRFGENPNRMQQFYQLQVILKPDPGNPQELFEESLAAIGINVREHDLRYVEDNWESPALGAWGLGWEVWLDGQEITQFTYFQQSGGFNLDPVSVEITYGLDRIALALQRVNSVWELDWGGGVPYGDILLRPEIEHCEYYFNLADVDALRTLYDVYQGEAKRCLDAGLVMPAHDYNLKCSHIFNILDTRGAVSVTERALFFRRMREITRGVSELYMAQRGAMGYPLLNQEQNGEQAAGQPAPAAAIEPAATPQIFVLEIGTEELPAGDLSSALEQLRENMPALLVRLRLDYEQVEVLGTPRRLAVLVQGLASRQTDLETEAKGPPAERAFDAAGNPTKAAEGFARSKGVDVSQLRVISEGNKQYVAVTVHEAGRPAVEALAEALPNFVAGLKFEKSMRWNASNVNFSRPVRWLVALVGDEVVPFRFAGVPSGRVSRGLRPYGQPEISIDRAADYLQLMAANGIVMDPERRREIIGANASQLATEQGGRIPDDPDLLAEVTNLVERPTPLLGTFAERYLELPAEVLVAVMRKHQRYFPVYSTDNELMPYFITVRNGDSEHLDLVREGNEHVLRARFADAEFFYKNDMRHTISDFISKLGKLTFQPKLGSMLDKTHRLEVLTPRIAAMLGLDETETAVATRAASLAKADLATEMVVELTSLQGIMGGHYAQRSGEEEAVVEAIAGQYQAVSSSRPGLALALADRLDSLVGLFAAGMAPKGSNDPYALRRAAIHIVENLIANEVPFDLGEATAHAAALLPIPAGAEVLTEVLSFITGRLETLLRDRGYSASVVKAVLAEQAHNPFAAYHAAGALQAAIAAPDWPQLLDAYARCVRIVRSQEERFTLYPDRLQEPAAQRLYAAYEEAAAAKNGSMATFVDTLRRMELAITAFFDDVLVMAEDPAVRTNRLALLQHVAALASGIADLSFLEGF